MAKAETNENISSFQIASFVVTIILIIAVVVLMTFYVNSTAKLTRQQSYETLSLSTEEVLNKIEDNFRNDRVNLRILSRVIAESDSLYSLDVSTYLSIYDINSLISNIAILTPENKVIQLKGNTINAGGVLDYDKEVILGEHISTLQPSLSDKNSLVIRSYMPIRKSAKTIGLLYTEMNPANIGRAWAPTIYNGAASFCIVDRRTGNMIINTMDSSLSNISDLNHDNLTENVLNGRTGFQSITNSITEETIYVSFIPMILENWEILVAVSENEVFESVQGIRHSLNILIVSEILLFLLYLLWTLYNTQKSINATEKRANIDVLTNLQNRNRYEAYCKSLNDKTENISCIYIDANGLHEINNTRGHLVGDQMLRFIADTLKVEFGEDHVYRIGGDEFVVFQRKKAKIELELALERIHNEIGRNNYHVSSGFGMGGSDIKVNEMIKTAEQNMYEEKRKYYESMGMKIRNKPEEDNEE